MNGHRISTHATQAWGHDTRKRKWLPRQKKRLADSEHSPNPFVVPRFIGAVQRNVAKDRMNAVTTNGS